MAETTTVAEQATTPPLTVDQAMIEVMREIGPVGKNGRNQDQGYFFRAQEDIVAAARGPMAKHGLRMLPRVVSHNHFDRGKMHVAIIEVEYTFRGPAGDTMPPILVIGEGADPSDKASNKAMTAAKKYAMIQAFEIASGADDGDRDHPVDTTNQSHGASTLNWYIGQISRADVWGDARTLRRLLDKAIADGVADELLPTGEPFRQVVEARGISLWKAQQEQERRQAEEAEAVRAQMSAEFPTPPQPAEEWVQGTPSEPEPEPESDAELAPPPPEEPEAPPAPEPAQSDAPDPASTAREPLPSDPAPTAPTDESESPAEDADSSEGTPDVQTLRLAPEDPGLEPEQRALANTIAELELQAQMLGVSTLEFVADLLPPGGTSVEDIKGGSRLMDHVRAHRPEVLKAFVKLGMTEAATAYANFGQLVPARNINKFLRDVLKVT
jgi:hypothetical protein